MWIDIISKSEAQRKLVEDAVDDLKQIGLFGALMEVASEKNNPHLGAATTERYALRAAWSDGYMEALKDIYLFKERFVLASAPPAAKAKPDFGVTENMLKNKDFNNVQELKAFKSEF